MTLPDAVVGDAYTSDHAWHLLEDLVDVDNRMAGQAGEHEAAARLVDAFEDVGLRGAGTAEFDIPGWWRGASGLTVEVDGRSHEFDADYQSIALPGSPSGDVTAELVDVGDGLPEEFAAADLAGKLVVASSRTPDDFGRWIHRSEKYGAAVEAGAAGFVFRNHVEGCLPPTGSIGDDGPGSIPAVGVSKEVGARLVRYCEGGPVEARLAVDCRNEPTTSPNVEGVLGPDTEEAVLITGHVDAHDIAEGANDNGVGSVLVAEVGRLLAQVEDELETQVRCVVFGSEEVGLYGAYHYAETHAPEEIKCVVNVDGAGYSRNLDVYTHGFDALGEAFEEASDELGVPIQVNDAIRPHSDHWPFVQRGMPGAQARSTSGSSGRGWGHTHADTLDKLDVRDLRELAVGLATAVAKLAEADRAVEHTTVEAVRDATVEQGFEEGMRNAGSWPFDDLLDEEA
jgi:Zn-dependent M28 family amino/carboxypeptidase